MNLNVGIIDYGSGNLLSVMRAVEHAGGSPIIVSAAEELDRVPRLILPGVGAFEYGMQGLTNRGLVEPIRRFAFSGRPLMGICLGMQMLSNYSYEFGQHRGLGLIPGDVVPLPSKDFDRLPLKTPHIGWANLRPVTAGGWRKTIFNAISSDSAVYLVHSYYMRPASAKAKLAEYDFGGHGITAAVQQGKLVGCQFHPEKSGHVGINILRAFLQL